MSHILTLGANNQQLANQNSRKWMKNVPFGALHILAPLCTCKSQPVEFNHFTLRVCNIYTTS